MQGSIDQVGLRIDDAVMAIRTAGAACAVWWKSVAEAAVLSRGSRRGIPARTVGHRRRVGESRTMAVDVAAGASARIPGGRPRPRASGRRERCQASQRDLRRTNAK